MLVRVLHALARRWGFFLLLALWHERTATGLPILLGMGPWCLQFGTVTNNAAIFLCLSFGTEADITLLLEITIPACISRVALCCLQQAPWLTQCADAVIIIPFYRRGH